MSDVVTARKQDQSTHRRSSTSLNSRLRSLNSLSRFAEAVRFNTSTVTSAVQAVINSSEISRCLGPRTEKLEQSVTLHLLLLVANLLLPPRKAHSHDSRDGTPSEQEREEMSRRRLWSMSERGNLTSCFTIAALSFHFRFSVLCFPSHSLDFGSF